jgi:hypothetical protein
MLVMMMLNDDDNDDDNTNDGNNDDHDARKNKNIISFLFSDNRQQFQALSDKVHL